MPESKIVFYKEGDAVFFSAWLDALPIKVRAKCLAQVRLLRAHGNELRRPIADFLRDGIYELRPTYQGVHYRILYFFNGKDIVVISHGITKRAAVPAIEIDRAVERKKKYEVDPKAHGWKE